MGKKKKEKGIKIEAYPASHTFEIALTSISVLASAIVQQLGGKEVMQTIGDKIDRMGSLISQKLDSMENTISQKLDSMEKTLSGKLDKVIDLQNQTIEEIKKLQKS